MSAMQDFFDAYEELFEAYTASGDANQAYARMVGALKVIIPFNIDKDNLAKVTEDLKRATKDQTFKILAE